MNKTLLTIFHGMICASITCQTTNTITAERNAYRPGDLIVKQQVEFKDPGPSGRGINWDFSMLNPVNEEYKIRYMLRTKTDSTHIVANEHQTSYRYLLANDTVWLYEYQNRTTKMTFTKPEAQLKFPFKYGDSLKSEFEAEGNYCEKVNLIAQGKTYTTMDGTGKLITPTHQTLQNVVRVRRVRDYNEIGIDSASLKLEVYSWYVAGFRYPVFETFITYIQKADSIYEDFKTSFYYPIENPENQYANDYIISRIEKVFTEGSYQPNPVISDLNISFKLTREAKVWFTLHTNIGIPVCQTQVRNRSDGFNNTTINMSNLTTGTYSLYVHVDDMVMKQVIIKK